MQADVKFEIGESTANYKVRGLAGFVQVASADLQSVDTVGPIVVTWTS